ncbi:hypothetical protein [Pseudoxanthomonas sp. SGT-18]|uniref:hypothetical protein n=1 Tax=Pseudoxanthomonas sp. SGT-18 TaxID=2493087 RepID=UPI000F62B388|nr:hypothetical protein [Pseudoxanthomonas sp. SGT-18]
MKPTTSSAPACSLDARDFQERVAWIAALNDRSLLDHLRQGRTLRLRYALDAEPQVQDMVAREQACCAFLEFDLQKTALAIELTIGVPTEHQDNADVLLAPFLGEPTSTSDTTCCGAC